jgi:hypothetical protein
VSEAALNLSARRTTDDWNLSLHGGFQRSQECAMQAIVEKVMRAFTHKSPVSDDAAGRGRQEATEFATQLLENFKQQLALRSRNTGRG